MQVRHGVMLVGGTMGGKTTCYRALASALTTLAQKKEVINEYFKKVHTYVLNPKVRIETEEEDRGRRGLTSFLVYK
jgi:hypothetical protein